MKIRRESVPTLTLMLDLMSRVLRQNENFITFIRFSRYFAWVNDTRTCQTASLCHCQHWTWIKFSSELADAKWLKATAKFWYLSKKTLAWRTSNFWSSIIDLIDQLSPKPMIHDENFYFENFSEDSRSPVKWNSASSRTLWRFFAVFITRQPKGECQRFLRVSCPWASKSKRECRHKLTFYALETAEMFYSRLKSEADGDIESFVAFWCQK